MSAKTIGENPLFFTAVIKRDGDWWIGWVQEIPGANAQERSREELLESLREAVRDILELRRMEDGNTIPDDCEKVRLVV